VGAAAELDRPAVDVDHAHDVAVLLPEEHHRAEILRLGQRGLEDPHLQVRKDPLVHPGLHLCALLRRQRRRMREVEAELVGAHGGAGLASVVAEHLLQHLVEQVRRRVVRHRRVTHAPRHDGPDAVALSETRPLKHELLVAFEPQRLDEIRARAVLLLDPAGVGDLAAPRRIERRLGELDLEEAVAEVGVRGDRGPHVELLVADELRPRRAREARLVPCGAALARDDAVLLHLPLVLLLVHGEAPLTRELLGQLDREAVCRREVEGVVPGDLALGCSLLEDRHPALERLAETLLLGGEGAANLLPVLDELGIRPAPSARSRRRRGPAGTAASSRSAARAARRGG